MRCTNFLSANNLLAMIIRTATLVSLIAFLLSSAMAGELHPQGEVPNLFERFVGASFGWKF
jgi:hypothetical protein